MPQSVATFLADGAVAGTWRFDDGRISWESFRRLDAGIGARSRTGPSGLRSSTPENTMAA